MSGPRETAITALLTLVTNAYAWRVPPQRRMMLWSDVPRENRPAAFLYEGGSETSTWSNGAVSKRTIEVKLFVYTDDSNTSVAGASVLNTILDAVDAAFALSGADQMVGRNTLGGTAYWCRIEGNTLKEPGDLDGDGVLLVPIKITLP